MQFAIIVLIAVAAVAVFWHLSSKASRGDENARTNAAIESVILFCCSLPAVLIALYLEGVRCDESCTENYSPGIYGGWWHTLDAWQWNAQLALALAGTASILIALILTLRRRHRAAPAWLALAFPAFGGWAAFLAPLGNGFGI